MITFCRSSIEPSALWFSSLRGSFECSLYPFFILFYYQVAFLFVEFWSVAPVFLS